MIPFHLLPLAILLVTVDCDPPKVPQGRGLFKPNTVTVLVEQKNLVTELAPSSCVVVEPSLPPCRHVRQADIRPTATQRLLQTTAPHLATNPFNKNVGQGRFFWSLSGSQPEPQAKEKSGTVSQPQRPWVGWDGWFFDDVTVTQTIVHQVTKRIEDPSMLVKFSVKGCEPTRLPFDLPKCKETGQETRANLETVTVGAKPSKEIHYVLPENHV